MVKLSNDHIIHSFFVLLLLLIVAVQLSFSQTSTISCINEEREALLEFKASFVKDPRFLDPSKLLVSWEGTTDCCKWDGVRCNETDGHVSMLNLRNVFSTPGLFAGSVDPSLLKLKHLAYLDLSGNCFNLSQIPYFLGSMLELRYLYLSHACFYGRVPPNLGNLTNLLALDINADYSDNGIDQTYLFVDNIEWISSLSSLQYIDLSGVNLSQALNLMQVLNTLPSLLSLRLRFCSLHSIHLSYTNLNSSFLPRIQGLDMSYNRFNSPFPMAFQNMSSLRFLKLSKCRLGSAIPLWLGSLKNLVILDLQLNLFTSTEIGLSSIIRNMSYLREFHLSYNPLLRGDVFGIHGNLSVEPKDYALEILDLFYIYFGAYKIPDWLGQLNNLRSLNLGYNLLIGGIPASVGELFNLRVLQLGYNNLDGVIPNSLGQLQNLEKLDITSNSLKGVVSEIHLANLSRLHSLWMGDNSLLSLETKPNWVPPFQLQFFSMRSCKGFGTEFPPWLRTQTRMKVLSLRNMSLAGAIPAWLKGQNLSGLDLSYNKISGALPESIGDQMPNMQSLLLIGNLVNGSLPQSVCKWKDLNNLYLSTNNFHGTIPGCLFTPNLFIGDLSSNNFSKIDLSSVQSCPNLSQLMLGNNILEGELPLFLRNCNYLNRLDLGGNRFTGSIPIWVGEKLRELQILKLRDNMFNGTIPSTLGLLPYLRILDLAQNDLVGSIPPIFSNLSVMIHGSFNFQKNKMCFQDGTSGTCSFVTLTQVFKSRFDRYDVDRMLNIDLSNNNLVGYIPREITELEFLMGLNLSHNYLTGEIPSEIGRIKALESLDLSFNQLSGPLPMSMSDLSSLGFLKLSNNNFSGHIPQEGHQSTFNDASTYENNPYLCGYPLSVKCSSDKSFEPPAKIDILDHDYDKKWENMWLYIMVFLGYFTGFWGVVGVLILKRDWRYAYFRFVEETKDQIHVKILVNIARLKRGMRKTRA